LHGSLAAGLGVLLALLPASAADGADAPVTRLVDHFRYTATGDVAVFTYVQAGGSSRQGERVQLWDSRGVVAEGALGPLGDGGTRSAELRVDDLPAGEQRLKACSTTACASTVHLVYDGPVDGVVAALLARPATSSELGQLAGHPIADVARIVAASPERRAGIVRELYHYFLGRAPEPAGLDHWVEHLDGGGSAIDVVVALCGAEPRELPGRLHGRCFPGIDLLGGVETEASTAEAVTSEQAKEWVVRRVFVTLLGREPELGARRYWASTLDGGVATDALLVGVLSSDEYAEHAARS
jgi:hypothetical protein